MANLGQRYVGGVPWLFRVVISSGVAALIIGWIIGGILHRSPFWKIDTIVFAILIVIESIFRLAQNQTKN